MKTRIKDRLILLSIHPEKGWVRSKNAIINILLAAALIDLALENLLTIESGKINIKPAELNDPLLDELIAKLSANQGKRLSWVLPKIAMYGNRYYRMQMTYLDNTHQISTENVEWLGITCGKRYRVHRSDRLKPMITDFERVLVYGRQPSCETLILINLLGSAELIKTFFAGKEIKSRVGKKYKELSGFLSAEEDESLAVIFKVLSDMLKQSKAAKG